LSNYLECLSIGVSKPAYPEDQGSVHPANGVGMEGNVSVSAYPSNDTETCASDCDRPVDTDSRALQTRPGA